LNVSEGVQQHVNGMTWQDIYIGSYFHNLAEQCEQFPVDWFTLTLPVLQAGLPAHRCHTSLLGYVIRFNCGSSHTFYSTHSPEICVKLGLIFAAIETQVRRASLRDSSPQSLEHPPT